MGRKSLRSPLGGMVAGCFVAIQINACFLGRVDVVFGHSSHHLRGSIEACVRSFRSFRLF
ncbi:hypothetical protein T484DRAFT_1941703 [Baffinella frigidus]|nr:hypothetical protein T484DRAFT_1941703 [Cryptophyta sp. CCMP2293]